MHKRKYFTCSILNWIRRKKSSNKILEAAGLTQAELPPISFSHILRSNDMRDELISEVVQRIQEPDIVTDPFDAELSFSADEEQEVI